MTQLETLELEKRNKVAIIYLNRPPYNPLNQKVFAEMSLLMDQLENDQEVNAIVITGKGEKAFAAGADIKEMAQLTDAEMIRMNKTSRAALTQIQNSSKPIIAAMNGLALGGGLELALACDLRICTEHTKMGLPEINLGILPGGGGTQRLQRLIGQAKAKELLFFGDVIHANEALALGLVSKVVPQEEFMDQVLAWAGKLAEKPMLAMRMLKTSVNTGANLDLESALDLETTCFGVAFDSADRKEGMQAFMEKRKPNFTSR